MSVVNDQTIRNASETRRAAFRLLPFVFGFLLVLSARADSAPAAEKAAELPGVDVLGDRVRPAAGGSGPATLQESLRTLPRLQLRSQGLTDGQTDLRIRGSSFSGAGLALGGLALRNPQTEHFNAELPLPAALLGTPEVLTGLDQARGTGGNLVGTVANEFQPVTRRGAAEAGVGEVGRNWQNFFWQTPLGEETRYGQTGLGVFGGNEHAARTDGRRDNGLNRQNAGLHLQQRKGDEWQADLLAAAQDKEFGARGFYGAPASMPSWEKVEDRLLLGSFRQGDLKDEYVRFTGAWRHLDDTYQLNRFTPTAFDNHTLSDTLSANADGALRMSDPLLLRWRAEGENESIRSLGLGDHDRQNAALALLPEWSIREDLRLTLGGKAHVFSGDAPAWLPVAGLEYDVAKHQTLYLSYTETVRQPSYTELYYNSIGSLGSSSLQRQENQTVELGWKGSTRDGEWDWRTAVFHENSQNAVDWAKLVPGGSWKAMNLYPVETWGTELGGAWHQNEAREFGLSYAYLRKNCIFNGYASRYMLDYPEHDVTASFRQRFGDLCELRVWQGVSFQTDNAVRTGGGTTCPAGVELRFRLPRLGATELVLAADNLWNDNFQTFPGQPGAGRRCSIAIVTAW